MILISIILILSALTLYRNIENVIVKQKGNAAMNISIAVAKLVEQDMESFKKLVDVDEYYPGSYDEEYYLKMQQIFQDIKKQTDVKFLYSARRISNDEIKYIFDGENPDSDLYSPIGSVDFFDDVEKKAYKNKMPYFTPIYYDTGWGELLTGVAPLIDPESGESLAYIAVDLSADKIHSTLVSLKNFIILNFLFLIIFTGLIFYKIITMATVFSDIDYMTGLYNKSYHERYLKTLVKKSRRDNMDLTLIMIDLDNFKEINDFYGHQFGDKVLKELAETIKSYTRNTDKCCRYGGDEFVVLLPDANEQYATRICDRFLDGLSSLILKSDTGIEVQVSISMGIAQWRKDMTPEQLTTNSDRALYISKRTGKNRSTIYTDS